MTDPSNAEKNALEHKIRAAVLAAATGGKTTTTYAITEQLEDTNHPTVAYHFRVLEGLGLLVNVDTVARDGRTVYVYTATKRGNELAS